MQVRHHFEYAWPEGVRPMLLHDWVATLSKEEQDRFYESERRQRAYRAEAIAEGLMDIAGPDTYVWRDEATAERNKRTDLEWKAFFDRYILETQTIFTVREERE
jgi:hypothetical protein